MKWLGYKPLYTLLLLTEKPADWPSWRILLILAFLEALTGWLWVRVTGDPALAAALAGGLLFFHLADWALLAALPRLWLSFGAVQPPLLALGIARWSIALLALLGAARWLAATLVVLAAIEILLWVSLAYGTLVEPRHLNVTRLQVPTPRLPNPGRPLVIVQISDLHVERLTRRERALPALVADLAPDLIVLTGDFLNTSYRDDPRAVADLKRLLAQMEAPLGRYAIWGTAEVDLPEVLRPALIESGVVVLEDQAVEIPVNGHRLWLMGLICSRDLERDGAILRRLLDRAPLDAVRVLLYHTPDLMPQASELGVDLYLAGHTHGGQWRVPGFGALVTSSRFWKRYEAGHYVEGGTHLYVSRGIGFEGFGAPRARFLSPPEVVAVSLRGRGKAS